MTVRQKPKTNWHLVIWPIIALWGLGLAYYATRYNFQADFQDMPGVYLIVFAIVAPFVVLVINGIAGTIAHDHYQLALYDAAISECKDCGRRDGPLHVVDFYWYLFLILYVVQFGERGKYCSACAKVQAERMLQFTVFGSCLCPPIILWVWFKHRAVLKRIGQ